MTMKKWTVEELTEMWIYRGYSKKIARAKAEKEYKDMHRPKDSDEIREITREMLYN